MSALPLTAERHRQSMPLAYPEQQREAPAAMAYIVVVDDEEGFTSGIATYLRKRDHEVAVASSIAEGRKLRAVRRPDVLVLDLMLPDGNGLDLLAEMRGDDRPGHVILITGHSGIKDLIGNVAGDSVTYLRKPVSPKEILRVIDAAHAQEVPDAAGIRADSGAFVGESPAMRRVFQQIEKAAASDIAVLVRGESGTGKELVAESLHELSGRKGPLVPVNCGALSKELLSAQLFGHEKGSFTGAQKKHRGFFERASGGTLFLDEITEMPLEMQTHLLRVLETGRVLPVGAEEEIEIDARLVVATNRDPAVAIKDGVLREDLYFRISVFPIEMPPLRDRGSDIGLLATHFLAVLNSEHGTKKAFSKEALEQIGRSRWPGNVRELKHAVHRAYVMAEDDIVEALVTDEAAIVQGIEGLSPGRSIAEVEKDLILKTLAHYNGNKKAAAESLGVSVKTLYNRLNEYGDD